MPFTYTFKVALEAFVDTLLIKRGLDVNARFPFGYIELNLVED